jgi:hypothetical protein
LNQHWNSALFATRAVTVAVAASALSACGGGHSNADVASVKAVAVAPEMSQDSACQVSSWHVAEGCALGQKIVFLPESWGNEQLPVMFAALNCDLRYQVVATKGAVVCIFRPVKPEPAKSAASATSSGDSGASR